MPGPRILILLVAALLTCAMLAAEGTSGTNASAAHSQRRPSERRWRVNLTAAPDDFTLAQISFPHASPRLSERTLRVRVSGPFGDDYMALATVAPSATQDVVRALVLIVDRPSPLLDPVYVHLRLTARAALGKAMTSVVENPFERSSSSRRPALCDLAHGHALSATQLSELGSRGTPLPGFDAAAGVAQAYDAACSLPYASPFKQAVQSSGSGGSTPAPGGEPPSPQPPAPGPPHCIPCDLRPGYACPLNVSPNICVASTTRSMRSVSAVAH